MSTWIRSMADAPLLTIAFLERLPDSSAKVIAGMRPQDAAALFEAVPTRIVTPIVERMEKWPAALCLQHISEERAAAILSKIAYQDATVLLRLTPVERREAVLAQLPTRLARDLTESLRYPRNCVGAWMDLSVPTLSAGATVKDAIAVMKSGERPAGEAIFVVDDAQRLAGLVPAESLLRHSANTKLGNILQAGLKPLFARSLLRDVHSDAGWNDYLRLPVAGRNGQLLGTLSRHDMMSGLSTISAKTVGAETDGLVWSRVGDAFVISMAGLAGLFGDDSIAVRKRTET